MEADLAYRLVAIDLDDTLLNSSLNVGPRARAALARARARGVIVTLATGRMYASAAPIARELGFKGPLITYQGAWVRDVDTGETYIHRTVPNEFARSIIDDIRRRGFHINIYLDDRLYMAELTERGERYARLCRVDAHPVGNLLEFLGDNEPTKVLAIADERDIDALMAEMLPRYQGVLHVTKSKPHFLEFSHPQATKGAALEWLAAHYGVPREAVMAIGDSYNDFDMLEFAGLGVVVGNAREEIKARADYVTASGEDDGVAEALEKFILP